MAEDKTEIELMDELYLSYLLGYGCVLFPSPQAAESIWEVGADENESFLLGCFDAKMGKPLATKAMFAHDWANNRHPKV